MKNNERQVFSQRFISTCAVFITVVMMPFLATAGPGHNHGEESEIKDAVSLPRFALASNLFEVVGVVDGKKITIYLDRAPSNEVVKQAAIELEIGTVKLKPSLNLEGEFVAELTAPLTAGVFPIVATVTVDAEIDLLAGELDLHAEQAVSSRSASTVKFSQWHIGIAIASGLVLIIIALMFVKRVRRARAQHTQTKYNGGAI